MGLDFNMRSHSRTAKVSIRPCLIRVCSCNVRSTNQSCRRWFGRRRRKPIRRTAEHFDQPRDIAKVPGQHDASRLFDRKNMSVLPVHRGRPYGPAGGHTRGVRPARRRETPNLPRARPCAHPAALTLWGVFHTLVHEAGEGRVPRDMSPTLRDRLLKSPLLPVEGVRSAMGDRAGYPAGRSRPTRIQVTACPVPAPARRQSGVSSRWPKRSLTPVSERRGLFGGE